MKICSLDAARNSLLAARTAELLASSGGGGASGRARSRQKSSSGAADCTGQRTESNSGGGGRASLVRLSLLPGFLPFDGLPHVHCAARVRLPLGNSGSQRWSGQCKTQHTRRE